MSAPSEFLDHLENLCDEARVEKRPWTWSVADQHIDYGDVRTVFRVAPRYEAERAARLTVAAVNALPELIRLARVGLEAEQEALRSGAELSRTIGTWDEDRQQWVRP